MTPEVAELLMHFFVQRRDVKSYQCMSKAHNHEPGKAYHPIREYKDGPFVPLTLQDMRDHLDGKRTYGHYLMDSANNCRVFAFDIDLDKTGFYPAKPEVDGNHEAVAFNPMQHWMSRQPGFPRDWIKYQFRMLSEMLAATIRRELQLPALITYSGSKGMHVYALTGQAITGEQARAGIDIVLDSLDCFAPKGHSRNFFRHVNQDPVMGYPNFTIETFPKQERVDNKKEQLGNLMRLPLGRNQKTTDPTFFINCRSPMSQLVPLDPIVALTTLDPWGGGDR